ncbi:serine/threonine protein kinase [Myxococcota bacterium]|jgi:serine/threonine protein kinase|nr:serine/threonine protein kinase [Myxococcota bacterium]
MDLKEPSGPPSLGPSLIGRVLDGRYRILSELARGGMGRVYKAEQQPLGRPIALKVLEIGQREGDEAESFRQRFFREAAICAKLTHPNTVRIFDYGKTEDGIFFIAMELLEGLTLRQVLTSDAPLEPWRVIELTLQICGSLAEAHGLGLVHRDLKPSNIILTKHADGREFVNILDFGLVKDIGVEAATEATQAGVILGSPMYMSPEQILQSQLDGRSDIYSLGVTLFSAFTGRKPFRQESALALMNCHLNVPPPPFAEVNPELDLPASLEWITRTCLQKDPARRFASVKELARALRAADLELRGALPNLVMELDDAGRVRLPPEFEEQLSARGVSMSPTGASGPTRSIQVQAPAAAATVTLNTTGSAPAKRPRERSRGPGPAVWGVVALIGLLFGLLAVGLVWRLKGEGATGEAAADLGPDAPDAPAVTPPPSPDAEPTPSEAAPEAAPAGAPVSKTRPPPDAPKPPPPANTPSPTAPPIIVDTTPAPVPTPEPKPEPKPGEEGWAKPNSDLKDPWKD